MKPFAAFHYFPWVYFFIFSISDALWAYAPLGPEAKLWILVAGVLLPVLLLFKGPYLFAGTPDKDILPPASGILIFSILTIAVILRFWKLTTLFAWPDNDEGVTVWAILRLNEHWDWKFFHGFAQFPPLFPWLGILVFKITHQPLLSLWLGPAFFSVLLLIGVYFAIRCFFTASTAYFAAGLVAFSYWPLSIGRFCQPGVSVPAWACLVAFILGKLLTASSPLIRKKWAIGLGFSLGLGSFTFTPWLMMGFWAGAIFIYWVMSRPVKERPSLSIGFIFALFLSLIPFLWAVSRESYGHHIRALWVGQTGTSWLSQLSVIYDYMNFLFGELSIRPPLLWEP